MSGYWRCAGPALAASTTKGNQALAELRDFLAACQIDHDPMSMESALEAARIMRGYARNKGPRERTAQDFLIGAHAITQTDALLTTDAGFFRHHFAGLVVQTP